MFDVLVELHRSVRLVTCTLVKPSCRTLRMQKDPIRTALASEPLCLYKQQRPEARMAKLGQHRKTPKHPCIIAIGARLISCGEHSTASRKFAIAINRHMKRARIFIYVVELILKSLLLHEHADTYLARILETPQNETSLHSVAPF